MHVFAYLETSEVRYVVERHLFDIESEAALVIDLSEWAITIALYLSDFNLSTVTLLLILLSLIQWHRVWVLVLRILSELVGVETDAFSELRELHGLQVSEY